MKKLAILLITVSPFMAVKALLSYGYPAAKIKYFRGGMQNWKALGLTTIKL